MTMPEPLVAKVGRVLTEPTPQEREAWLEWMRGNAFKLQAAYDAAHALSRVPGRFQDDVTVLDQFTVMSEAWTEARGDAPAPPGANGRKHRGAA